MARALLIALVAAVVSTAPAFAGAPPRPWSAVEKFTGSQVVVTGKVTAIEKDTVEASSPSAGAKDKLAYKVAVVKIDTKFAGAENLTHLKVGFVPPDPNAPPLRGSGGVIRQREPVPELKEGQEVLVYLSKHPTAGFHVMPFRYLPADLGTEPGKKELEQVKKFAAAVAEPMKGLKSDKAEVRAETAVALVTRYCSSPVLGGEVEQVAIDAEESRLILKALADSDWNRTDAMYAFHRLGLTDKDGLNVPIAKPGENYITVTKDAFVKWLAGPGRVRRSARRWYMRYLFASTLVGLTAGLAAVFAADEPGKRIQEHKTMPKAGGDPSLRLDVKMARAVWGEWERVRFDYRIVNGTKKAIQFEDGDSGRGFAGKLLYLRDPGGKIRAFGAHWADPMQYRPSFPSRAKSFDPGAVAYEHSGLEPSEFFGRLGTGKHALQVVVPAGRLTVDGKETLQLASEAIEFEVVALTPELRRKMEATPKDDTGVSLETEGGAVKLNKADRSVKLRLVNHSKAAISFSQYHGTDLAPTEAEFFGGDGSWHKESLGWCATGLASTKVEPKQVATISTHVPSESGRFVRFTLLIAENGKGRKVVSPVVELKE